MNEKIRDFAVSGVLGEAPVKYRGVVERAFAGEASPRGAIKAMCLTCTGFMRDEVTNCTGFSCPLWKYRPYQQKSAEDGE